MNRAQFSYKSPHIKIKTLMLVGLFVLVLLSGCDKDKNNQTTGQDDPVVNEEISPKTYQKQHLISAFVQSQEQAQLAFQVSGRLSDQWVEIGQQVKLGDNLLSLYNPVLQPQIDRIEAQITANQAELIQTQSELQRNQSLSDIQAISQNQLDRLQSQVSQLLSKQDSLNAQLKAAKNNFNESTLTAPFSGEVADILIKPGTMVQAGQAVITLSGSHAFEAPLFLSNDLIRHLAVNQILGAFVKQQKFQVTVKEISRSANPASQLFKVLVSLPVEIDLLSGQKIEVIIPEPIKNIYQLPVSAVIDDGINEPYVYSVDNNQVQHTPVQVIDFYQNRIWVRIDRKSETLTVITDGQSSLTPPQKQIKP